MREFGKKLRRIDVKPDFVGTAVAPSSLKTVLAASEEDYLSLEGLTLTLDEALTLARQSLEESGFLFVADDGTIKVIGKGGKIHKSLSDAASPDLPDLLRAVKARIARLDAQRALAKAVREEAEALLELTH